MSEFKLGYFSHNKKKYHTDAEEKEYAFIRSSFNGFTICPNKHMSPKEEIPNLLDIVSKVDVVFVSELNGYVEGEVYLECKRALELEIPVFVVQEHNLGFRLFELKSLERTNTFDRHSYATLLTKKYSPKQFEPFKRP